MKFVHYTFPDSTSAVPHFEVNAFQGDVWVGHYQRRGRWLENVFVPPQQRGRGACAALVRHAVAARKGLRLLVRHDNAAARACYARAGFVETGRRADGMLTMSHR